MQYSIPPGTGGAFDEQPLHGSTITYIPSQLTHGNLFVGTTTISNQTEQALVPYDNVKILNSDNIWQEGVINNFVTVDLVGNIRVSGRRGQTIYQTISNVSATLDKISSTTGYLVLSDILPSANIGDIITQSSSGAVATVTSAITSSATIPVTFIARNFVEDNTIIKKNGVSITSHIANVICHTSITAFYTASSGQTQYVYDTFLLGSPEAVFTINHVNTLSYPASIISVGVTPGAIATEGVVGFDEGKFDETRVTLPEGITIDPDTGWMTGYVPSQQAEQVDYTFEINVYKRDNPGYYTAKMFTLTVLGDLTNKVTWLTPSDLGTIENGQISDLCIQAESSRNKALNYQLVNNNPVRLPQGLKLTLDGLIIGRVSFELFNLDHGNTTIDGASATNFDSKYTFTVIASDYNTTASATRTFTIKVINRNKQPYENLYLKAMMPKHQRQEFRALMSNQLIFPNELIYRRNDSEFGLATDIKTLFLSGLTASTLRKYTEVIAHNHQTKQISFGDIKVARAVDAYTNVKYEVIYIELLDTATNASGESPPDINNLSNIIDNPYLDGTEQYTVTYPNSFNNMKSALVQNINYENKGALPDWMTSKQSNGRVLGFTRAAVLAYTVAGAGEKMAYQLRQSGFKFNQFDFTVDRYQVDNSYTQNFDIAAQQYLTAHEVTFDRYPILANEFTSQGVVDYAASTAFELINNHMLSEINDRGGLDGCKDFKDGELIVFAQQEFFRDQNDIGSYNQGWNYVTTNWSGIDLWDETMDITSGVAWDKSEPVPGYQEHNLNPNVINRRIGVWKINISSSRLVTLTFEKEITLFNTLRVQFGSMYGGTNIYYDPVIKAGNLIPNYSIIPQEIKLMSTKFDGNGTRFFDHRDTYTVSGSNNKYIKFSQKTIFDQTPTK